MRPRASQPAVVILLPIKIGAKLQRVLPSAALTVSRKLYVVWSKTPGPGAPKTAGLRNLRDRGCSAAAPRALADYLDFIE